MLDDRQDSITHTADETPHSSRPPQPLHRPPTHIGHLLAFVGGAECGSLFMAWLAGKCLERCGMECPFHVLHLGAGFIMLLLLAKPAARLAVKLYQHYAPERVRRRCHCLPTCSEYALIALDKYHLSKALHLIYIRLTRTCGGRRLIIDYP